MSQSDKVPVNEEKVATENPSLIVPKEKRHKLLSSVSERVRRSPPPRPASSSMDASAQPAAVRKRKLDNGFVGVHIGAGQHSHARTATYLAICASACQEGVAVLKRGGSAVDAATAATTVLENAGETNAGYGSNLVGLPSNCITDFRVCSQNWLG